MVLTIYAQLSLTCLTFSRMKMQLNPHIHKNLQPAPTSTVDKITDTTTTPSSSLLSTVDILQTRRGERRDLALY
ncbi:hypothetical protein RIF29_29188 [Crotalaria pallida]|uniref:Uncharacterized protein n=1 Tax=Crotalaria pallida TaxID=3830 RepID=A0AAN9EF16_CROPI